MQGAVVVGHSMGFSVAVALADRATQLVDRLVNIDEGPTEDSCSLPFIAKLGYTPLLGQAMWRLTPSFAIKDGYADAFAPGFDLADGFPNPDQVVDDYRAMTYTSYKDSADEASEFTEQGSLDQRLRQIPSRCSRSSAPRTRSASPGPHRRPTPRSPAPSSRRSRAPATRRTSRNLSRRRA